MHVHRPAGTVAQSPPRSESASAGADAMPSDRRRRPQRERRRAACGGVLKSIRRSRSLRPLAGSVTERRVRRETCATNTAAYARAVKWQKIQAGVLLLGARALSPFPWTPFYKAAVIIRAHSILSSRTNTQAVVSYLIDSLSPSASSATFRHSNSVSTPY